MKKINKYFYVPLLILLSFAFLSESESQFNRQRRDGLWWNSLSVTLKRDIVIGYYTGAIAGFDLVKEKIQKNDPGIQNLSKGSVKLQNNLLSIDPEYMVIVVDSLYAADTVNLGLMAFHAIWLAGNQVTMVNKKEVKMMYEAYRKGDCLKFKNVQELREYKQAY